MVVLLAALALALLPAAAAAGLSPDPTWSPELPSGLVAAQVSSLAVDDRPLDRKRSPIVYVAQRGAGAPPLLAFSHNGTYLRGFGSGEVVKAHGLQLQPAIAQPPLGTRDPTLWVTDTGDHTLKQYEVASGKLLLTLGTPSSGGGGNGTQPVLQFGNVADVAFDASGALYISDGDGGVNNRVLKLGAGTGALAASGGGDTRTRYAVVWAAGNGGDVAGDFSSPHSLAYDGSARGGRVWVADRNNFRVLALDAGTGQNQSALAIAQHCFPGAVADGAAPWSVRADSARRSLSVAVAHSAAKGYGPAQARIVTFDTAAPWGADGCPAVLGSYPVGAVPAVGDAFQWTLHEIAGDGPSSPHIELYGAVVDAPWEQATVRFATTAV